MSNKWPKSFAEKVSFCFLHLLHLCVAFRRSELSGKELESSK